VVKRSSGPISRIPGEDRVAVRVGVVQMEKANDQMTQNDQMSIHPDTARQRLCSIRKQSCLATRFPIDVLCPRF